MSMTPRTKKPHYVPASYLQFWNENGEPDGRSSKIYWCDGHKCSKQSVGKCAVESGLYSISDPNSAEDYFNEFEADWSKLVKQLVSGKSPNPKVLAGLLLLQSGFFLLRNPKFSIQSPEERINAYKKAIEGYWHEVLMNGKFFEKKEDALEQLVKNWECHLLPAQGESWITSDNPVLLLNYKQVTPAIIFFPITPNWALLALKSKVISLNGKKVTEQDTTHLNSYTVINSTRHVYSNDCFDESDISSVSTWLSERPDVDNWIGDDQIHLEPFDYPIHGMTLSFL